MQDTENDVPGESSLMSFSGYFLLYSKLRFLQSKNRSAKDASRRVRLIVAVGNTRLARRVSQATLFVLIGNYVGIILCSY